MCRPAARTEHTHWSECARFMPLVRVSPKCRKTAEVDAAGRNERVSPMRHSGRCYPRSRTVQAGGSIVQANKKRNTAWKKTSARSGRVWGLPGPTVYPRVSLSARAGSPCTTGIRTCANTSMPAKTPRIGVGGEQEQGRCRERQRHVGGWVSGVSTFSPQRTHSAFAS